MGEAVAEVRVRNLDDSVVQLLKDRARREGVSLEALLRQFLTVEAKRPRTTMVERLERHHEAFRNEYGVLPDSSALIRGERDRWG